MNEKLIRHAEREKVGSTVWAFLRRLSDIKAVKDRQEAAAMLSLQLLDQFSGVLFKGEARDRVQQFVESYVPKYCDLGIYDLFKDSLEYNYSVEGSAAVSSDATVSASEPVEAKGKRLFPQFVNDLEEGVQKATEAMRHDEEKRRRALEWYESHTVPRMPLSLYTDEQQSKIMEYYTPRIKSRSVFTDGSYVIGFNFSPFAENGYRINVSIDDQQTGKEITRIPLDILVGLLRLKKVAEVVEECSPLNAEP